MNKEFIFMPEHKGRNVRHADGRKGRVFSVSPEHHSYALLIDWGRFMTAYSRDGRYINNDPVVVFLDQPAHSIAVKDCDLAVSYGPDGITTFGITAEYQGKEQPATVALFDFLRWALDQNFIGGYSAEEPGEEIVTLPVPPELEDNRLSLRVLHVCDWLRTLPLSVIETACNGNLSMWQLIDTETSENV